tara:strand:- start:866 stop:1456 length:591 start_codon:yes stop_codon:yes gene_type:complete
MAIGTFEFTADGAKPFHDVQSTTSASSVTVPVGDSNREGMVLVEGFLTPTSSTRLRAGLKNSSESTGRACKWRTWGRTASGNATRGRNVDYFEITANDNVDNDTTVSGHTTSAAGISFHLWISLFNQESEPYKDVMFHYRSIYHNGATFSSSSNGHTMGQGTVMNQNSQDITECNIYFSSGNIWQYRIRCYNFFGN